ncbi:M20 family metallopeptidase [[Eubacterium] cellulosolvens]
MDQDDTLLLKTVDGMKNEITEFLAELVKAKSVNPPGDTRDVIEVIRSKLASAGLEVKLLSVDEDKPNIVAKLGPVQPKKKLELLYNSHVDTVPVGEIEKWQHEPFGAEVEDGKMYGRGIADAKGSVAGMVMAAKALADSNIELSGNLVINPVSDEEVGGFKGAKHVLDSEEINPDYVVVGEITANKIAIAEKGIIWFKITTEGRTAHASTPWDGINAIDKMINLLKMIDNKVVEQLKQRKHLLTPPPSMNIGMITGGVKTNVVADKCEVTIDRRILPNETIEGATKELQDVIDDMKKQDPEFKAKMEVLLTGSPIETSQDSPIVKMSQEVCSSRGISDKPVGYLQASDGRFYAEKGIPTILLGPGLAELAHSPDEWIALEEVVEATKIYSLLAAKVLR